MQASPRADEPFEAIGIIAPSLLVQRWHAEFGIDVSASFSSIRQFRIIKGMNSGIVYFDPSVVGDENLYRGLSKRAWYYPEDKWELRRSLADIRPGQKLLDARSGCCSPAGASLSPVIAFSRSTARVP